MTCAARARSSARTICVVTGGLAAVMVISALAGCRRERVDDTPPPDAPTFAELAQHQHERLSRLETVYGSGVIELRWRDEDGRHYEQGNMELWIGLPSRVALRVFKAGRDFLWLGSDESHFWIFDMTGDETALLVDRHDAALLDQGGAVRTLQPLVLMDLSGLGRLDDPLGDGGVDYDADRRAWVVTAAGRGGPIRMFFDVDTLEPVRVESMDRDGAVVLHSRLHDPLYVERSGGAPEARLPRRIHIETADGDGRVSLAFDRAYPPSDGMIDDMFTDRVFDFEVLTRRMPPDVIDGEPPQ